jgi:hypothetical protein
LDQDDNEDFGFLGNIVLNLYELFTSVGILLVDDQGHRSIAAKIASTRHDTFHKAMQFMARGSY